MKILFFHLQLIVSKTYNTST